LGLQLSELREGIEMKFLWTMFVALFLVAGCGGGGSGGSTPSGGDGGSGSGGGSGGGGSGGGGDDPGDPDPGNTPDPESAAGIWTGYDSTGDISLSCLVTSTQRIGCRHLDRRDDSVTGVLGQILPGDGTFTGDGQLFTVDAQTDVAFSGSFVIGETLYLTASSLDKSHTFTLQYDNDRGYETPSSLEIVSGQYEGADLLTGNALEIDITDDGTIITRTNSQAGLLICNGSGYINPIDPLFSEYAVSSLYVTCTGEAPVTLEGVATLSTVDTSSFLDVAVAAPDTMVIGSLELVRTW
jgi:hypothetical protein